MERRAFGRMLGGWLAGVAVLPVLLGRRAAGKPTRKREPATDDYPPVVEYPVYSTNDPRHESYHCPPLPRGTVVRFSVVPYKGDGLSSSELTRVMEFFAGYRVLTRYWNPGASLDDIECIERSERLDHRPSWADVQRILAEADRPAPHENPRPDDYPPVQEFPVYEADDPRCGQASTVFDTVRPGAVFHMVIGDADENPARAAEIMRHWREQEVPEYFVVTGWHTVPAGMFGNAEAYQSPDLENLRHRPTYADVKRILAEEART